VSKPSRADISKAKEEVLAKNKMFHCLKCGKDVHGRRLCKNHYAQWYHAKLKETRDTS
jgi:hypothetical protein